MSVKPILFNTDMVKAILDGRKRVTRRVVKPQPEAIYVHGKQRDIINRNEIAFKVMNQGGKDCYMIPPYQPGDILYVRETWNRNEYGTGYPWLYKASPEYNDFEPYNWKPSIHMPKEAARIWLKVTDVRVERLQDITDEQAELEGTHDYSSTANGFFYIWDSSIKKANLHRYGWDADPWVWVIEFERCEKPQEVEQ